MDLPKGSQELVSSLMNVAKMAINDMDLADAVLGVVTSTNPLTVNIEGKFTLNQNQIIKADYFRTFTITIPSHSHTVNGNTTDMGGEPQHNHTIPQGGTNTVNLTGTLDNNLRANERVWLLKMANGQKYFIFSRA